MNEQDKNQAYYNAITQISNEMKKVVLDKDDVIKVLLTTFIAGGHALIEDVPGVGKTTLSLSIAKASGCIYRRAQFTPDVMPSDITGFMMFNRKNNAFEYKEGSIMSNIFLADEINRTSPKTQSSLLEAMEEGNVTIDGKTYPLPTPFMVIATQNPAGHIGTTPLPESQLDRFMVKISIGYPSFEYESLMLTSRQENNPLDLVSCIATSDSIISIQNAVKKVRVSDEVANYIITLISKTRTHPDIFLGASPRASISVMKLAQATAFMNRRMYVIPEDVKTIIPYALCHRIHLSAGAKLAKKTTHLVLEEILSNTTTPYLTAQV